MGGIDPPSAFDTDLLKVRVIGVFALIVPPGCGLAIAAVAEPAGNQLTSAALELSHVRGAAAT
jgi:hypothetical protein